MYIKFIVVKFTAVNFANIRIIGEIIQRGLKDFRYILVYPFRDGQPGGYAGLQMQRDACLKQNVEQIFQDNGTERVYRQRRKMRHP